MEEIRNLDKIYWIGMSHNTEDSKEQKSTIGNTTALIISVITGYIPSMEELSEKDFLKMESQIHKIIEDHTKSNQRQMMLNKNLISAIGH